MKFTKYLIFLFGILLISNVYALGCCLDLGAGVCTPNSEQSSCAGEQSQFYNDATCNSASECRFGCCSVGLEKRYTIESACYSIAKSQGLEYTWSASTQEQCATSASGEEMGACIVKTRYDSSCSFTARRNCQGNFSKGLLCSNPSLNTTCEKLTTTMCYDGDVYYKDSCNNPDERKENCDYDSGSVCELNEDNNAFCKNLNCVDKWGSARTNGESWCIGLDGNVLTTDVRSAVFKKPAEKEPSFTDSVGSRFFKQSCLNGEVITEPCADYRNEVCIPSNGSGSAECVSNLAGECAMAMPDPENPADESWKEECNSEWCYISRLDDCVSFGTEGHDMVCGEDRENWEDYAGENGLSTDGVSEVTSPLLEELGLVMCLPKISTGSDISSNSFSEEDGVCSAGNFEKSTWLDHDQGASRWRIVSSSANDVVVDTTEGRYGNAGIISTDDSSWEIEGTNRLSWCGLKNNPLNLGQSSSCNNEITWCCGGAEYIKSKKAIDKAISEESIANPKLIELLNSRTVGLGDCAGDSNWAGETGSTENSPISYAKRGTSGRSDHMLFSFTYTANPWSPPASGDCSLCGADDLPCSEYRCKSLGKGCEYIEPRDGSEKSYCVSSSDNSPPSISHSLNPQSPIPPFSSVQINVSTNEASYCRFNVGVAGNSFEGMQYEVDGKYSDKHSMILHVPGKKTINDSESSEYSLITDDGKYELFVRCQDVAGNWNLAAYKIGFEVMQTPDKVPPAILNFTPISGSAIKFNTTEKEIEFKLNEPAECRWDYEDKPYEQMGIISSITEGEQIYTINSNQFSCDTDVSDLSVLRGYYCSGTLANVTLNLTKSTNYYIRCKDQPWLEGNEDEYYKRNANPTSVLYLLRPSNELTISEITPVGDLILPSGFSNITLTAKTKGGGYSDRASCKWRLLYKNETTVLYPFANTNSQIHTQIITNKSEGDYKIEVVCADDAGNIVNKTENLKLRYDKSMPIISRIYNDKGSLKIVTNELATCKFMNAVDLALGCSFSASDNKSTSMNSNGLMHTTSLKKGSTYFVKCKDYYDNQNSACAIIGKVI